MIKHLRLGFCLPLALVVTACSGSSSDAARNPGGGSGSARNAYIINNTAGGAGGRLYGRVSAIALEDDQGELTGNLVVGTNPEFLISDPLGEAFGLELKDFGPGKFTRVHVLFVPGTVMFKTGTATPKPVIVIGGSIDAPFAVPLEVATEGAHRFQLRHRTQVVVKVDGNGDLTWDPDMLGEASGSVLLQDADVEVVAVDVAKGTALGVIRSMNGLKTTVSFLSNSVLVIAGVEKTVGGFLGALKTKDVIRVFGLLDGASNTRVAYGERVDLLATTPGMGRKNKVRGTITAVDEEKIDVRLFEIRIGGRDIPKDQPVTLDVDSSVAKIKYVPRYSRHGAHLEPKSLAVDMFIEVEWLGVVPSSGVLAHKINIRSDGRFIFLSKLAGTVKSVDTTANTIAFSGEFQFGNVEYSELTLAIGGDTLLVEDRSGAATELKLSEIKANDSLWILGRKQVGPNVDAILAVVTR